MARIYSSAELSEAFPPPSPRRRRWGKWTFKRSNMTLTHDSGYEVDLDRCSPESEFVDWIWHLKSKPYFDAVDLVQFIEAVSFIIYRR